MPGTHVNYLLVGGGLASAVAASAIRSLDASGSILLVGQEINRPYPRLPLSRAYLRRQIHRSDLSPFPANWYDEHKIELNCGMRVTRLDTARRAAMLSSGLEISYDRLLLATGRQPRPLEIPGGELPNVYSLRTIEDADRLLHAVDIACLQGQAHSRGRGVVAVIGGGLLGCEIAAALLDLNLQVHLLVADDWPWARFAGENTGRWLRACLEQRGVLVRTAARPIRLEGDGRAQRVVLSDGAVVGCDLVVSAIGTQVNRELVRDTPIAAEKAILADAQARTNVPGIFAAGDCAAFFDPLFGKHRLSDHWNSAQTTGAIAGATMAGGAARFDHVSTFNSRVFDLEMVGFGEPRFVHRRLLRGALRPQSPQFIEFGLDATGRLCHALTVGCDQDHAAVMQLLKQRTVAQSQEEALKDPSIALQILLKL